MTRVELRWRRPGYVIALPSERDKRFRKTRTPGQAERLKSFQLWLDDPQHPSLHFKKIHPTNPIYSARIGGGYRVVGSKDDDRTLLVLDPPARRVRAASISTVAANHYPVANTAGLFTACLLLLRWCRSSHVPSEVRK